MFDFESKLDLVFDFESKLDLLLDFYSKFYLVVGFNSKLNYNPVLGSKSNSISGPDSDPDSKCEYQTD